jgi:hypothetical protein
MKKLYLIKAITSTTRKSNAEVIELLALSYAKPGNNRRIFSDVDIEVRVCFRVVLGCVHLTKRRSRRARARCT